MLDKCLKVLELLLLFPDIPPFCFLLPYSLLGWLAYMEWTGLPAGQ